MGSNTEKKPWTNLQNLYKKWSKGIKSDNFCCHKVGRAITKSETIEKSPILLNYPLQNEQVVQNKHKKITFSTKKYKL